MEMAAALNPLMSPARRDVAFALERWADEEAAAVVADRTVAAQALAHAALLADESETVDGVLALSRLAVADRVLALNGETPPRRTLLAVAAFLAIVIPAAWAAADATVSLFRLLLAAEGVGGP